MKPVSIEDAKKIKECLQYEPETGLLYWKKKPNPKSPIRVGQRAGSKGSKGYRRVFLCDREFQVHQVVWFFETDEWPTLIDHVNGNRSDNRFGNLRIADDQQNSQNRQPQGSSSLKGVYRTISKRSPFKASIYYGGASHHLGYFATEMEAAKAYDSAAKKHFGEFARLNFPEEVRA